MENSTNLTEVVFPTEQEIKSYFEDDVWNTMSDYDKLSCRNILHNYYVMKSLDLKPIKPSFLTRPKKEKKLAIKRKAEKSDNRVPVKKPKIKADKSKLTIKDEPKLKGVQLGYAHKTMSIRLSCFFKAVFKVYKRCHSKIKRFNMKKKRSKKNELSSQKNGKNIKSIIETEEAKNSANNKLKEQITEKDLLLKEDHKLREDKKSTPSCENKNEKYDNRNSNLESNKGVMSSDNKGNLSSNIGKLPLRKTMPLRRSVQTMTVSAGCDVTNSALVFVNAATIKKLSSPPPDPKPLTPQQQKHAKREIKKKMKNCRCVQTQTVAESEAIEEAKLVFFQRVKAKKTKAQKSAQPDAEYNEQKPTRTVTSDAVSEDDFNFGQQTYAENGEQKPSHTVSAETVTSGAYSEDEFEFGQQTKYTSSKSATKTNKIQKHVSFNIDIEKSDSSQNSKEKRYPRRSVPVHNYYEAELAQDDEYLFCDLCDREYEGDCPVHGPHTYFVDRYVPITNDTDRAIQTTPAMLKVAKSKIPGAGSGVWTVLGLPGHARLGPYEGEKSCEPDALGYSWTIMKNRKIDHYIAAHSTVTSNWMRFVNCARHESEQNLMAFQYKGQLFYRTVKPVLPKAELFVWYGKEYAEKLGISMEDFRSKDTSHLRNLIFSCDNCSTAFTSPLYLESHQKVCRGRRSAVRVDPASVPTDVQTLATVIDGRKTYCCSLCDYKTTNASNIRHHLVTHTGERPHTCDSCGKGFTLAGHLTAHKRIHTGEKLFKCSQCSYACNTSSDLSKHMKCHTGEKPYCCTLCPYKTTQSGALTSHMRGIHTGEKPHHCPHCDYKTAVSSNMKAHSRTHTGEKPYCCTLCPYKTTRSGDLTSHMRGIHTGEKPHHCPHCDYKTAVSSSMKAHSRTHTGEKPYCCTLCPYTTTQSGALTRHMRGIHTGEKPYHCPHCQYSAVVKTELRRHIASQH